MKKLSIFLCLLLAVLLLGGCGAAPDTEGTPVPEEDVETAVVTDIKGFLNALGPERCVVVEAEELRLDEAPDYGFGYSTGAYTWESVGGGEYALVIRMRTDLRSNLHARAAVLSRPTMRPRAS